LELLIGFLDERGFLSLPLAEIATTQKVPLARMKAAQAVLTTFDPPGIGADDLRHSLLIQLERREQSESLAAALLSHHFDDLAAPPPPSSQMQVGGLAVCHQAFGIMARAGCRHMEIESAAESAAVVRSQKCSRFNPLWQI
jgi:RNA polymerase sigma-54 factor